MILPQRVSWAVELLKPWRGASVLEVGCGRGVAAHAMCGELGPGGYLGIDRSKAAIDAAARLNAGAVGKGVAEFRLGELAEIGFGRKRFDLVLAINVNVFWTGGEDELAVLQAVLKPRGRMLLVYEAPSPARLGEIDGKLRVRLRAGGFARLNAAKARGNGKLMAMWASR